jgi:hypothetical protein
LPEALPSSAVPRPASGQGAAMIAAGWAAQHYSPSATIAVSGLLGVAAEPTAGVVRSQSP